MTSCIGQATTCAFILLNPKTLTKIQPKKLSPEAKFRLRFIEHYLKISQNVSETCRIFGITRSLLYKWLNRYNSRNLSSLENKSSRPHHVRFVTYSTSLIAKVREIRQDKDTATYSAKKIAIILARDYPKDTELQASASTIGRIIQRFKLFFTEVVKQAKFRSKRALATWKRRKPAGLHTNLSKPRTLIEFDMKHVYAGGRKYYAFCAIDVYTREALIHIATTATSLQAKLALQKVVTVFGKDVAILNDNGSENMGKAYDYLQQENITQYFARPHQPKDKPYIERLIDSYQRECLDQRRSDITNLRELDYYTTRWLNNYHYYRPHDSLHNQTPEAYCATMGITIKRREVSTM